ncbi:MAG: peptidoglycan DD-metalloendopeptidase family protein [Candidatus Magasanikbacteria bacterium]|nr:peptidoglycan DD-metalloendopeptidase family protein [Candidatus Magasanikbacteria bacterium]
MRYKILLKSLKGLIYLKRLFWWTGAKIFFVLAKIFVLPLRFIGLLHYKINYFIKRILGAAGLDGQLVKRDNLQVIIFVVLFVVALPQTKLYAKKELDVPGRQTVAYSLTPSDEEDYSVEEITATVATNFDNTVTPDWKTGALSPDQFTHSGFETVELGTVVAGGTALSKPTILSGATVSGGRDRIIEYIVQSGDSLGSIAGKFQISVNTILWENNLSIRSYLQPGDKLRILPINGVIHAVKRGDTLKKIAAAYSATVEDIVKYNKLKTDGSDLVIGEKILIPNGVKVAVRVPVSPSRAVSQIAKPAASRQIPTVSGYVWPTAVRLITQYFTWKHHGLDIAGGSLSTPNYAAKAGVVEKSQCGWNSGYGCVIIIDHGGGIKTLYGHNSRLLVSAGDRVETGQTIGLMGNTGNVRGRTGIHIHFEVWVNGVRTNPFRFVK